jgi:iron complex transport system ATP-binding protein
LLNVNSLSFSYPDTPVFEGVSFQVGRGQLCALLGPNGSGKSTLFKCCLRFLDYSQGSIHIAGQDIRGQSAGQIARLAAYVPQDHQPSFPYPVKDVVLMGRTPHLGSSFGISPADQNKALEAMAALGISKLADKPYHQLSGGQRQLVLIARALAQETPMLFLDEPTASLDFKNQLLIWRLLGHIAAQGISVLVCTHDPNHVLWFCERVIVLSGGRLIADDRPDQALQPAVLHQMYGPACELRQLGNISVALPQGLAG